MKKIFRFLSKNIREILIVSLSLLLLGNVLTTHQTNVKLNIQTTEYNRMKHSTDSLKSLNDSLVTDNFIMIMELHRHEMTRDEIFLKYPKVGEEYEYFLGHYTE